MSKRIKSFLITAVSIFATAFATLIFTPEWSDFVAWLTQATNSYAAGHNIPTAVVIVIGVLVAEVWKQLINNYIVNRRMNAVGATHRVESELY